MKFRSLTIVLFLLAGLFQSVNIYSQSSFYVKQVITANSGKFEYNPPYTDFVTLQKYNPQTGQSTTFGSILTQSAQNIVCGGHYAYIAAQDTVAKYDLNGFSRVKAVGDSGLNRMALYKGYLLVSKQWPVSTNYLEVLDTSDLSLVALVKGISGDCGGIAVVNDTVYTAVNGGWMGTEGKLAIIDPADWKLKSEVNFGPEAIGIMELFTRNNLIYSVNKTPYGVTDTGSITKFNPSDRSFTNIFIPHTVGAGTGILDSLLYLCLQYGIGSFNLNTLSIQDTVIIPDPGSATYTYIISSALDTLSRRIYANIGDYVTPGYCLVTSLSGDSLTSYSTGISSDAVCVDYRKTPDGISEPSLKELQAVIYPNPVKDRLNLSFSYQVSIETLSVTDISGKELINLSGSKEPSNGFSLDVSGLKQGMYYLIIQGKEGRLVRPFVVSGF